MGGPCFQNEKGSCSSEMPKGNRNTNRKGRNKNKCVITYPYSPSPVRSNYTSKLMTGFCDQSSHRGVCPNTVPLCPKNCACKPGESCSNSQACPAFKEYNDKFSMQNQNGSKVAVLNFDYSKCTEKPPKKWSEG